MCPVKISVPFLALAVVTCSNASKPWAALPERHSPAVTEAARHQASAIAMLPVPADAGIWLVQDTNGQLVSSGVLSSFPTSINSSNYAVLVPGAAGFHAEEFGFARTAKVDGLGPFRVAYVTVAAHS
jgi:hypothetical protein